MLQTNGGGSSNMADLFKMMTTKAKPDAYGVDLSALTLLSDSVVIVCMNRVYGLRSALRNAPPNRGARIDVAAHIQRASLERAESTGDCRLGSRPCSTNRVQWLLIVAGCFDDTYMRYSRLKNRRATGPQRPKCRRGLSRELCLFDSPGRRPGSFCARAKRRSAMAGSVRRARRSLHRFLRKLSGLRSI